MSISMMSSFKSSNGLPAFKDINYEDRLEENVKLLQDMAQVINKKDKLDDINNREEWMKKNKVNKSNEKMYNRNVSFGRKSQEQRLNTIEETASNKERYTHTFLSASQKMMSVEEKSYFNKALETAT
jgi:hypothetical protein